MVMLYDRNGRVLSYAKGSLSNGGLLTAPAGAEFDEAVARGRVYAMANQSTVVTQAGLSLTTPALTLAVKPGAKKEARLWYVSCTSLVTPGAAAAIFAALGGYSSTALSAVTNATVRNMLSGDGALPDGIDCASVATLPAAPVAIGILGNQATGLITTSPRGAFFERWYRGALRLQAGFNFSLQSSTASTFFCEYIFEVVDA